MSDEKYVSGEEHQAMKHAPSGDNQKRVTVPVSYFVFICCGIVLCVLSFWGGTVYQKHKHTTTVTSSIQKGATGFSGGGVGSGRRFSGAFGQVTSISSSSITINNQRTSASSTYVITSSTTITDNGQTASASSIQDGDTVLIMTSSTSSTTASKILVNPSFGGGFRGSSSATSGSATNGSATSN
jgi:hypothetical protein